MLYDSLVKNPLRNYKEFKTALLDLIHSYMNFLTPGRSGIELGPPGATFPDRAARLEGFARILWGVIPLLAGGNEYGDLEKILEGITHGVDPGHPEYWGDPLDYDQRLVEMAVFGYALCLVPEKIWEPLDPGTRKRFAEWLSFINRKKIPDCNWVFFRVLVNAGLSKVGAQEADKQQLEQSLEAIERFYLKDGWYNDGFPEERRARDYYIPWAMHYYGLIFARCAGDQYRETVSRYRERAREFIGEFIRWFSPGGPALPFGRSLAYRFAQSAFWAGLVFMDDKDIDWGLVKGLLLRNLRWWFGLPVFSESGLLSVGYAYPNLLMAERYNSSCSPLWALKSFAPLSVSQNHPFWLSEEKPLPVFDDLTAQPGAGFIFPDAKSAGHVYALSAGQWTPGESNEHNHMAEKYAKFAYSCAFGYSVATDTYGLDKMGHDNMLLVAEDGRWYRFRTQTFDHEVTPEYLFSRWRPFAWMEIETYILPAGAWHVRLHHIVSGRPFSSAEGGFCLAFDDTCRPDAGTLNQALAHRGICENPFGLSCIEDILGDRTGKAIVMAPNSNILYPHTLLPTLTGEHPAGDLWLGCAVVAHPKAREGKLLVDRGVDKAGCLSLLPDHVRKKIDAYAKDSGKGAQP